MSQLQFSKYNPLQVEFKTSHILNLFKNVEENSNNRKRKSRGCGNFPVAELPGQYKFRAKVVPGKPKLPEGKTKEIKLMMNGCLC